MDFARNLKKVWNMNVVPIIIGSLVMVSSGLEKRLEELEIRGRTETFQMTALRSARILRIILETRSDLLSLSLQWKITNYRWHEKLAKSKIIMRTPEKETENVLGKRDIKNSLGFCERLCSPKQSQKTRLIFYESMIY